MNDDAAPVLPDNISASGARRVDPTGAHLHSKKSLPSEAEGDPFDGQREQALRKETGEAARQHERLEHGAARHAKLLDTTDKAAQHSKPTRRVGFGSMGAAGGSSGRRAAHAGPHTKTEGLAFDISADAREFEEARAGVVPAEEEEEADEGEVVPAPEDEEGPAAVPQDVEAQGASTVTAAEQPK